MNRLSALAIPMVLAAACSAPASRVDVTPFPASIDATSGAAIAPGLHVARTATEWNSLWRELSAARLPAPAAPEVDFSERTVLCVALGERTSGGFGVTIVAVERIDKKLVVYARETLPSDGTLQVALLTAPIALATIEATKLPIELAWY